MVLHLILALIAGSAAGITYYMVGSWWLSRRRARDVREPMAATPAQGPEVDIFVQAMSQARDQERGKVNAGFTSLSKADGDHT